MRISIDQASRRSACWWTPTLALALLLKHQFSVADTHELQWMLQPLAKLVGLVSAHDFQREASGEWFSADARVRLVKACAGINFMLMSLLAYAWTFQPRRNEPARSGPWPLAQVSLLIVLTGAAWATALLANTLRIWVAMHVGTETQLPLPDILGEAQLHRLIGLAVYLPLLSLQMMAGKRTSREQTLSLPVLLYFLLMVLVPLLTGNAFQHRTTYLEHVACFIAAAVLLQGGLYLATGNRWRPARQARDSCLTHRSHRPRPQDCRPPDAHTTT